MKIERSFHNLLASHLICYYIIITVNISNHLNHLTQTYHLINELFFVCFTQFLHKLELSAKLL